MGPALRLRLFKLRFADEHCFIAVSHNAKGQKVNLPGVDLEGAEARAAFTAAAPLLAVIAKASSGATIRSISLNFERQRLLATLEADEGARGPKVIRIDAGSEFDQVLLAAADVHAYLKQRAGERLAHRPPSRTTKT